MVILIFILFIIPFLFEEPVLFSFICSRYFLYAFIFGLVLLRTHFNGSRKLNFKPFLISVFLFLIYISTNFIIPKILNIFYPQRAYDIYQANAASALSINIINGLFIFLGLVAIGFLAYNIYLYKWNGNFTYRFIETGTGLFFLMYPFLYAKAYIMIKAVVAFSIVVHSVYLVLLLYYWIKKIQFVLWKQYKFRNYLRPYFSSKRRIS